MGLFSKAEAEPETVQADPVQYLPYEGDAPMSVWAQRLAVGEPEDPEAAYRKHLLQRFESTRETLERARDAEGRAADLAAETQIAREGAAEQHREAALSLRRIADGALR